ncbi:hypothetical protein [Qipengyuania atrilutea]|uniref:Uncharacterized protein n=1 Tax=Qipengyuania atrilutea TaxID=2744473 RepID=A0A850HD99_9SPHN|nr:hypothetical protein [Actirhodobacter atriluteus]NVD45129.1 hypothetical protein [Actirhodobacter atriluteus]
MKNISRDWRLAILTAYFAVSAAAMIQMGQPDTILWYAVSILFLLWVLAPVAVLCLIPLWRRLAGIGAAISAIFGAWIYIDVAFIPPSDAQDGLIFLFLPIWQFCFVVLWLAAIALYRWLSLKER